MAKNSLRSSTALARHSRALLAGIQCLSLLIFEAKAKSLDSRQEHAGMTGKCLSLLIFETKAKALDSRQEHAGMTR
jgi:hypothetical protein